MHARRRFHAQVPEDVLDPGSEAGFGGPGEVAVVDRADVDHVAAADPSPIIAGTFKPPGIRKLLSCRQIGIHKTAKPRMCDAVKHRAHSP